MEDFKVEANTKHDQKIAEERQRITSEFEASYAQTVEHAKNAIAATKKQYEDQAAIDQARFISLKQNLITTKGKWPRRSTRQRAQNLSLQDQIDDLQEQLKHVAKAQHASVPKASVQNAETAATASVPHFNIATPRASDAQAAKGSDEPIQELKDACSVGARSKSQVG